MNRPKVLFAFFTCLALAWTGLLAYLAVTAADPVVVSIPQLHLATLVVAAEVKPAGAGEVEAKIVKVFKNESRLPGLLPTTITVQWGAEFDVHGQSTYLLALVPAPGPPEKPTYTVVGNPMRRRKEHSGARVYPYTDSVRIQTERIVGG